MEYMTKLDIDTKYGKKTISVSCMDITHLYNYLDIMTISAFYRSYSPTPRTLLGALRDHSINIDELSYEPDIDLRKISNIWLSKELANVELPIRRIGCIETSPYTYERNAWQYKEKEILSSIKAYFKMLDIASISGVSVENIGMPIIGGGAQKISMDMIAVPVLNECLDFLKTNEFVKNIYIITNNPNQAYKMANTVDNSYSIVRNRNLYSKENKSISGSPLIFISYSSKDKNIADNLCSKFEKNGVRVWYAPRNVDESSYASSIVSALTRSSHFVVILSKNSFCSNHVLNEVDLAFQELHRNIKFYPLKIDEEDMSSGFKYYLSRYHWMDAHVPPIEKRLDEFVNKILSELDK